MIIAVATEGNKISGHFGRCESFTIFEIEASTIKSKKELSTVGNQHGLLPAFLKANGVSIVIAGGMGQGAKDGLISNRIQIISGISGSPDEAVKEFINGSLESKGAGCSGHGDHQCSCGHH